MMLAFDFIFLGILLIAAINDYKSYMIPDTISLVILAVALAKAIINRNIVATVVICTVVFLALFILALLTNGIGGGDVKLITPLIAYMGITSGGLAIAIACILTLIYLKIKKIKNTFFAPFLFAGCAVMCFLNYL